ncbi:MAG: hypothetical protein J6I45_06365, partial [Clostridia bacterium]|nr:hypothetical protein [Clostridia bacterium]
YLDNIMFDEVLTRNNSFVANSKSHEKMFAENQSLFIVGNLGSANTFRSMEADFGILPTPKYNASQENYASSVSIHGASVISVPITSRNLEMVGVILEAMAAESKYTVIPAFYETVLKDKATRDLESVAMMDIIINSMTYDVGVYYSIASFPDFFLRITGSAYNAGHSSYPQQTSDIASFYAKYEKILNKGVESLIKSIDKWVS